MRASLWKDLNYRGVVRVQTTETLTCDYGCELKSTGVQFSSCGASAVTIITLRGQKVSMCTSHLRSFIDSLSEVYYQRDE